MLPLGAGSRVKGAAFPDIPPSPSCSRPRTASFSSHRHDLQAVGGARRRLPLSMKSKERCGQHLKVPISRTATSLPPRELEVGLEAAPLVVAAARELTKAHTAFDVRKPTTARVHAGVFRPSRNPVYFSMLLLCIGIALLANSLAMLLLSLPAGSGLCLLVIRKEERYLEQKFGNAYLTYKATVPRWIKFRFQLK